MSEYGNLEAGQDSDYFMVHMMAMTTEKLRGKGDIAGELAYRDQRIAEQAAELSELKKQGESDTQRFKEMEESGLGLEATIAEQAAEVERLKVIEEAAQAESEALECPTCNIMVDRIDKQGAYWKREAEAQAETTLTTMAICSKQIGEQAAEIARLRKGLDEYKELATRLQTDRTSRWVLDQLIIKALEDS
jgi:hypothetical protein